MSTVSVSALVGQPGHYDSGMYQTHLFLLHEGDGMAWEMIDLNHLDKPTVRWRPAAPDLAGEALLAMIGVHLLREPAPKELSGGELIWVENADSTKVSELAQAAKDFDNIQIQVSGPESSLSLLSGIFEAQGLIWAPFDEMSPFLRDAD
jgi:hypothetical protein